MKQMVALAFIIASVTSKSYLIPSVENYGSSGKTLTFTRFHVDASHKILMIQSKVLKKIHNFTVVHFFHLWTWKKYLNLQASGSIEVFSGSDYKTLFKHVEIDWCKFMSKKGSKILPAAKIVIESIRPNIGNLFQECPYFGDYEANITISKNIVIIIPEGLYKYNISAGNEYDEDFFHLSLIVEVK